MYSHINFASASVKRLVATKVTVGAITALAGWRDGGGENGVKNRRNGVRKDAAASSFGEEWKPHPRSMYI